MPELPEVETIVSDLNKKIVGLEIKSVQIRLPKIVKNKEKNFIEFLVGNKFTRVGRRGKLVIFYFRDLNKYLLVHLKMTGQLIYKNRNKIIAGGHSQEKTLDDLPNKYTHVIITFRNGVELLYNDVRQFGYLKLVDKKELDKIFKKFGQEPLGEEFTLLSFKKIIKRRKKNIKALLFDQSLVAGIGNIYADEILFASGVDPRRGVDTLSDGEVKKIYSNTKKILKKAIKYRGTTFNDYRDAEGNKGGFVEMLKVYGRDGEKCFKCKKEIKKIKVAGRGTRYCEKCQK